MVFKLAPSKFKELSQLFDLNIRTVTVLTEIETVPEECGAIFIKKTELEVMFDDFEKSLNG
ncbi:hypothetical protein GCM10022246_14470 [Pedobacter ginsengiterrae]|uniref:Uncharacterized protein n=1 Tax=Pedobacter ginsengiterrae TaxID=871696 RepID=A0ABP7PA97_9SPHI|nr:hypothetical protein [Pedobacter aquatilis]